MSATTKAVTAPAAMYRAFCRPRVMEFSRPSWIRGAWKVPVLAAPYRDIWALMFPLADDGCNHPHPPDFADERPCTTVEADPGRLGVWLPPEVTCPRAGAAFLNSAGTAARSRCGNGDDSAGAILGGHNGFGWYARINSVRSRGHWPGHGHRPHFSFRAVAVSRWWWPPRTCPLT